MTTRAREGDPTPDEAAAIAAVLTSLEETQTPSDTEPRSPSAWRRAALREGTGRSASVGDRS
jgi:hypothetical protein